MAIPHYTIYGQLCIAQRQRTFITVHQRMTPPTDRSTQDLIDQATWSAQRNVASSVSIPRPPQNFTITSKLRQENAYLDALNETAIDLMGRLDVNDVLSHIVARAAALSDTSHAFLYLVEPDGQTMRMQIGAGLHARHVRRHVKPGEGLSGTVWQSGEPLSLTDYSLWDQHHSDYDQTGVHATVGVPLKSREQVIGVLGLSYAQSGRVFDEPEVEVLCRFGQLAAIALDNARLLKQTRQQAEHVSVINAVVHAITQQLEPKQLLETVYEQVRRIIVTDGFFVCLYDAETDLATYPIVYDRGQRHFALSPEPPSGNTLQVLQSGEPLLICREDTKPLAELTPDQIIGNAREVPASMLYVPLRLGKQVIGVMSTQSYHTNVYDQNDVALLGGIANHVTIALENARLYSAAQEDIAKRKRIEQRQNVQYAVSRALADSLIMSEAAPRVLQVVCEQLDWDIGELWRVDTRAQVLRCVEIWHCNTPETAEFEALSRRFTFAPGVGLPGRVWAAERPIWIPNVMQDPYFPRAVLRARVGVHGALSFPVQLGGDVLGVIEFFSQQVKPIDNELLETMSAIGNQLAQFIERQRAEEALRAKEKRLNDLLRRFVAHNLADLLMTQSEFPQLGGQRRAVSLLFADFRGYTSMAETLEPEQTLEILNRHFAVMGRIVAEHGGTINQYAGDMLMAIFNAPDDQPDHALRAVRAALAVQTALLKLCEQELAENRVSLGQVGIGINTGPVVAGYLGFEERFDYTAIGDTTNIAARLSSLASSGSVLIGPQTHEAVKDKVSVREKGAVQLKGRNSPVMVYEVVE